MLITPADHFFSLCIRERADWKCEKCGTKYERGSRGIHCSHYFGRSYWAVRFEPLNAFSHCFACHRLMESNPDLFQTWTTIVLGPDKLEIVREKAYSLVLAKELRRTKGRGEIAKWFESEYNRMLELRKQGQTGRIEFVGWR